MPSHQISNQTSTKQKHQPSPYAFPTTNQLINSILTSIVTNYKPIHYSKANLWWRNIEKNIIYVPSHIPKRWWTWNFYRSIHPRKNKRHYVIKRRGYCVPIRKKYKLETPKKQIWNDKITQSILVQS